MSFEDRDITALVSSRICHDLISPLGAISNGLELIGMAGAAETPELALIRQSVESAKARIRFFRVAFGAAAWGVTMPRSELVSIVADNYRGGRVRVDWQPTGEVQRREAKLAFLAILCCASALPMGGEVTVSHDRRGWTVHAASDRLRADAADWAILQGEEPAETNPAQVHFRVLAELTRGRNPALGLELAADHVTLKF